METDNMTSVMIDIGENIRKKSMWSRWKDGKGQHGFVQILGSIL